MLSQALKINDKRNMHGLTADFDSSSANQMYFLFRLR